MEQIIKSISEKLTSIGCVDASVYYDKEDNSVDTYLYDTEDLLVHDDQVELELSALAKQLTPTGSQDIHMRISPKENRVYYNYTIDGVDTEINTTYK